MSNSQTTGSIRPIRLVKYQNIEDMDTLHVPTLSIARPAQNAPITEGFQMPSIPVPEEPHPARITGPCLPIDSEGRPYLKIVNPFQETIYLVEAAVHRYIELHKLYPAVILLSALRYLNQMQTVEHYYPRDLGQKPIPYSYEPSNVQYDILLRGERHDHF